MSTETRRGCAYFHATRSDLEPWGKPIAFYSDKHGCVFRSNVITARRARAPSVDSMDDPLPLDRHYPFLQPVFVSTAQIAATSCRFGRPR
jgi:hypothetical protein